MGVLRRGAVWYVKWKDASGRWIRQRTDCRTKGEANVLFAELVRQADRARRGLDPQPMELGQTLWGLCDWWLENRCNRPSRRRARSMLETHVKRTRLAGIQAKYASHAVFESYFDQMAAEDYAPRTINQLRIVLSSVFTKAAKAGLWAGVNPLRMTTAREVAKTPRPVLLKQEVEPLLEKVPENWRGFFAAAVYLGLRKGELCGLLKSDYDPVRKTVYIGRSYKEQQTKGKRVDHLPVSGVLAPFLEDALKSPGPYMFPGPKGKMRDEESAPEDILKSAMRRAGFIDGWRHKCRRCKRRGEKVTSWDFPDDELRRCERCNFKLWPVAIPRPLVFHDLRHTAATHLLQEGVDIHKVQRILRHSNITTTAGTYAHLLTEDLRSAVERLGPPTVQPVQLRPVSNLK